MSVGSVSTIWRYPVSGLQGEKLDQALVTRSGISGDHQYVVRTTQASKILDPISRSESVKKTGSPGLLGLAARLTGDPSGAHEVSVYSSDSLVYSSKDGNGHRLSGFLDSDVEVVPYPRIVETRVRAGRTLHLLTDSSLARMRSLYPEGDFDERRFRPNILINIGDPGGFVEDDWVGHELQLGEEVSLMVTKTNIRCKLTTLRQSGLREDEGILRTIERENANQLGVMCKVLTGGTLRVGSAVSLVHPGRTI